MREGREREGGEGREGREGGRGAGGREGGREGGTLKRDFSSARQSRNQRSGFP